MKKWNLFFLLIFTIGTIGMVGCEGPEGEDGLAGPGFPMYSYMGDNEDKCGHCHGENADQWKESHHAEAYADLAAEGNENNPYCLHCHTVGWDSPIASGDTVITTYGPDLSGFDDYWMSTDSMDMARADDLKGVQCENCHGPMGPTIYDHQPETGFSALMVDSTSESGCADCHGQFDQYYTSGHAMVLENSEETLEEFNAHFGRASCAACHTTEGFIKTWDPAYADKELPEVQHPVGCVACHDPHGGEHAYLRQLGDVTVLYDANDARTLSGKGPGQICAQCHHARRDVENVEGQLERGSSHFGPHGSPQMDMYVGSGSYEIAGYTYDRGDLLPDGSTSHVNVIEEACVTCHMPPFERHGSMAPKHTFTPEPETCAGCHPGSTTFDVIGRQTEIAALMETLITELGFPADSLNSRTYPTPDQRKAGYAYVFVNNDGSHGVHNYRYAKSLLDNAIAFVQDSINVVP